MRNNLPETLLLTQILIKAKPFFTKKWLKEYGELFQEEILQKFAGNLIQFYKNGVLKELRPPFFSEEITPLLNESFAFFKPILDN